MSIPKAITKSFDLGDGKEITLETGRFARQAHGSVVVKQGETMLLCTVVSAYEPKPGQGFFPLTVEYGEKFSAAGRIPGGFLRREGRAGDQEILVCRLVDRAIRPLFPKGYMNETQVIISLISTDGKVKPDALACLAASAAIAVSDIPLSDLVSEIRVARIDGKLVLNPEADVLATADLEILVGATKHDVCMVEGEMQEVSEEELVEAIQFGHEGIKLMIKAQEEFAALVGATEKREIVPPAVNTDLEAKMAAACSEGILKVASAGLGKNERKAGFAEVKEAFKATFTEEELEAFGGEFGDLFGALEKKVIRKMILDTRSRLDGRALTEVRAITIETDVLPRAHGSALFTRGETQSLTTTTLGSKLDEKLIDNVAGKSFDKFMLHYNFPPFCTGEAKPLRGVSRREVGHGNLATRSVKRVMPEESPYTTRVVSDILESNGSSSMATVCAASLSLMDAGIEIKNHIAGIAMGMISDPDSGNTAILTDILGDEDHLGDMDFKVTGTRAGICACQMDMKIDGLKPELMVQALQQAKDARNHILGKMEEAIPSTRAELKSFVPRMESIIIDGEFIGKVIGPGGKHIQELQKETETVITIEEIEGEKGKVTISSANGDNLATAKRIIKEMTAKPEIGGEYDAVVKKIVEFGVFVEFMPGHQGLVHISEISHSRIDKVEGVLKEGDEIKVKIVGVDKKSGKMRLSRKALLPAPEKTSEASAE
jgi:polyribonucleotide nucleotidyltransferase